MAEEEKRKKDQEEEEECDFQLPVTESLQTKLTQDVRADPQICDP